MQARAINWPRSLTWKLTLAFLLVALTVALLVAVFIRLISADQLDQLIIEQRRSWFLEQVTTYYQANGSWVGIEKHLNQFRYGPPPQDENGPSPSGLEGRQFQPRRDQHDFFGLVGADGRVIIPLLPEFPVGMLVPEEKLANGSPITVDGVQVGTVLTAEARPGLNPEEVAYLQRTNSALLLASGGAMIVALLMGMWLARTLAQPLRALTVATHRMAHGELEQAVPVTSKDEVGELTAAFNQMSQRVSQANQARRQMTADIAHELRTPLTVVAGYVEAMREGVLAPSTERLSTVYTEIERLQHLVGDLRLLSQADAGELKINAQPLEPAEILQQAQAAFAHQAAQKQIHLTVHLAPHLPLIQADELRLAQVLSNLLSNAIRHTPAGGQITLSAQMEDKFVALSVADTGPGIAPEDLPFVFERLYRGDKARTESSGEAGSGLGLAIAKALVEAHGGKIQALSELGRGTTVRLTMPPAPT